LFVLGVDRRRASVTVAAGLAALAAVWAGGSARLASPSADTVAGVRLRVVQPNIPQHLKWKPELRAGHVRRLIELSLAPAAGGVRPTHVVWPETAVPYNVWADARLRAAMSAAVPEGGLLITGAPRSEPAADGSIRAFNSVHAIDRSGALVATYDKRHLVPFGEYVPLRGLFGFAKLTAGRVDFQVGTTPRLFDWAGLPPVAVLVCYEVIFPAEV
ncbi:MAG: apolipoprotein N-acyltransferase, partial [Rhodospirillaceae bacterium]